MSLLDAPVSFVATITAKLEASLQLSSAWTCDQGVWDGVDFTPCFREKYLANVTLVIVAVSALTIASTSLLKLVRPKPMAQTTTADLLSPDADNLSRLEATVLLGALASNVLPASPIGAAAPTLPPKETEKIVNEFKRHVPAGIKRWDRVRWWVTLVGGFTFLGIELARCIVQGGWKPVVFPAFIALLTLVPNAPVTPLVTLHLVPTVLLFRSTVVQPNTSILAIAPTIVELVYWAALVSIPYADPLEHILSGSISQGGGSMGAAAGVPRHIEEPTSAFSRATYAFILPLLWKHYWKPITIDDIPAIREDDGAAASLASFRAHQARRDTEYAAKHGGAKRARNLGKDLIFFFLPEFRVQCVFTTIFIFLQYLPPTGLRLLLQFIKDREDSPKPTHVAVLYVGMMAIGQSVGVTVIGQALMIGRRVCVRLRAIIIAEVFAKALRRQDMSGAVKNSKGKGRKNSDKRSNGKNGKASASGQGGDEVESESDIGKNDEEAEADSAASSDGKIANLVSVDAFTISEICAYSFYLCSAPLAVIINTILVYNTLGAAALAGVAVLVFLLPLQTLMGKLFTLFQRRLMAATDARLDAVTEVIAHVKLIKFNAWESKFLDRMASTRKHELAVLAQRFGLITLSNVLVWGTPVMVPGTAFAVHVLVLDQPLTADRAFASLVLFNMLRDPLALLQDTVTRLLQAYTSCGRIQAFLDEPDTLKYTQLSVPGPSDPTIGFRGAMFAYPGHEDAVYETEDEEEDVADPFRLGELDLSFPPGQLSLVTGPVGSGKTTLILSLLGETVLLKGKVFMPDDHASRDLCTIGPATGLGDSTAYCAQTAWLVGASIRENITFGSAWDQARYDTVVDACALRRDFEIFELGDQTEVGEKGTTCSGGQKARIALARAIYSPARTIVLDDVLSAVDAQTARHIYTHVLQGPLMHGRTCILVTHAVNLVVPAAAFVVMLDDGHIVASGTPAELVASGALAIAAEDESTSPGPSIHTDSAAVTAVPSGQASDAAPSSPRSSTLVSEPHDIIEEALDGEEHDALEHKKQVDAERAAPDLVKTDKTLVQTETSGQGSIGTKTYMLYFRSMGSLPYWVIIAVAFLGTQALQIINNAWIKDWANSNDRRESLRALASERSTTFYLLVYIGLSCLYLFGIACRVGFNFIGSLHASNRLYNKLLKRILGAKMRFFDSTPSGRIMNRLSKDMASIDQEAAEIMAYFVNCVLSCLAVLVVVAISTPAFLFALAFIIILYWFVGTLYVTTSREIKRIDSVTRSPLFVSFSEALVGMSTIRSYGDSARFTRKLLNEIDANTRCFWYLWQANRVLNNLSNFVGTLVTVSASVLALRSPNMSAGAVGLSITYALSFTEFVLWVVRLYAAAEMSMNSVERVAEYLDLEVEEESHQKGIEPPAYWPSREGSVVVSNLTCKYAPQLEPVLRNVSFTIAPREKIGICGRTGSGKSTLALSFFRFLHQESGSIVIDGQDIGKLSLTTLRSRLTILPQEAQLFSGTIRDNMDPFGQHEDYEVWEALRQCGLAGKTPTASRVASRAVSRAASRAVSRTASARDLADHSHTVVVPATASATVAGANEPDLAQADERVTIRSLDEKVAVGGKNFSQGQRQLLALARGLLKLRTSSFLIMDESTANLDHATDTTIQNVLRTGLADTQMLVIAHRLMTVCGLDKILVLDHGKVIEFGTPWELLQDESGSFRDLCRQSGEEAQLFELAKSVHDRLSGNKSK